MLLMRKKIYEEALRWYEQQDTDSEVDLEEFVDLVIKKTADSVFEQVKNELCNEFETGNLTHPFVISGEYYLDLKLKDIKHRMIKLPDEIKTENDPKKNNEDNKI